MTLFRLSQSLMYAGLVPFVAGTIVTALGLQSWWIINDVPTSLALYALAIASFMSGIHWAVAQLHTSKAPLLLHSNLMVLLPWIAFVFLHDGTFFYLALAYVFIKQYLIDKQLVKDDLFSSEYVTDRRNIAFSVALMMLIIAGLKMV